MIENLTAECIVTWIRSISSRHQTQIHNKDWLFLILANQAVYDYNMLSTTSDFVRKLEEK